MDYIIRPIAIGDARGVNALRTMPGVFENILGTPAERVQRSEAFISSMDGNQHQFVAVTIVEDGSELVIGTAGLSVFASPRTRHSGGIGIMIHKDYQSMGVGYALMQAVLDMADNWLMLVRVELTVFVDNHRAIGLYKKCGFQQEGIKKYAAIRNGQYADEYMMARYHPSL